MMHVEVSVALNFVISYLYNKLPRRRVDMYAEELERLLKERFQGHWYPECPAKGSAFRCVRVSGQDADLIMEKSAQLSGMDIEEIRGYLPKDLSIWIDPCEVSYRIGEKGPVKILYSNRDNAASIESLDKEIQAANKGFNPDAQCFKPIDSLSSSMNNLNLSPSSPVSPAGANNSTTPPLTSFLNRPSHTPLFTTAMFAQTKFGSTKLKSQAKRPSRLSPTEVNGFYKAAGQQRSPTTMMSPSVQLSPAVLSPSGPQPHFPGGPLPGSQLPGSQMPGSQLPGPQLPSQLPGSQLPGSQLPGNQLPGNPLPGSQPAEQTPLFTAPHPAQRPRSLFPTDGRGFARQDFFERQQRALMYSQQQSPVISPIGTKTSPQLQASLSD